MLRIQVRAARPLPCPPRPAPPRCTPGRQSAAGHAQPHIQRAFYAHMVWGAGALCAGMDPTGPCFGMGCLEQPQPWKPACLTHACTTDPACTLPRQFTSGPVTSWCARGRGRVRVQVLEVAGRLLNLLASAGVGLMEPLILPLLAAALDTSSKEVRRVGGFVDGGGGCMGSATWVGQGARPLGCCCMQGAEAARQAGGWQAGGWQAGGWQRDLQYAVQCTEHATSGSRGACSVHISHSVSTHAAMLPCPASCAGCHL